jgi:transcription antitermination factor NusG
MTKGKWYAIHVFSQSEQKVKTLLEKTAVKKNVDDKIFEIVIPLDT